MKTKVFIHQQMAHRNSHNVLINKDYVYTQAVINTISQTLIIVLYDTH